MMEGFLRLGLTVNLGKLDEYEREASSHELTRDFGMYGFEVSREWC